MIVRNASCRCGQLSVRCEGEPGRISVCHCLNCQRRSGSAFAFQARFPTDQVTITGTSKQWEHVGDSGNVATFHFCPTCGSTLFYRNSNMLDTIAVAVGGFADPGFPPPRVSVFENRKHPWVAILGDEVEHD